MKQKQMFFWNSFVFFYEPTHVGNLVSGSSGFSKSSLYIWKFSVHALLKPSLKDFEHYLVACEMIAIVQQLEYSLALPFFGIEMETEIFSPVAIAKFSKFADILSAALQQHHHLGF